MKSLIVEDAATSRMLLLEILRPFGNVHTAEDGKGALAEYYLNKAKHDPFDLICLDIMMPGVDGQKVLKEIRRQEEKAGVRPGRGCRIIMTTALCDTENVMKALYELCDAYLVKPIKKNELLDQLMELQLIAEFTDSDAHCQSERIDS